MAPESPKPAPKPALREAPRNPIKEAFDDVARKAEEVKRLTDPSEKAKQFRVLADRLRADVLQPVEQMKLTTKDGKRLKDLNGITALVQKKIDELNSLAAVEEQILQSKKQGVEKRGGLSAGTTPVPLSPEARLSEGAQITATLQDIRSKYYVNFNTNGNFMPDEKPGFTKIRFYMDNQFVGFLVKEKGGPASFVRRPDGTEFTKTNQEPVAVSEDMVALHNLQRVDDVLKSVGANLSRSNVYMNKMSVYTTVENFPTKTGENIWIGIPHSQADDPIISVTTMNGAVEKSKNNMKLSALSLYLSKMPRPAPILQPAAIPQSNPDRAGLQKPLSQKTGPEMQALLINGHSILPIIVPISGSEGWKDQDHDINILNADWKGNTEIAKYNAFLEEALQQSKTKLVILTIGDRNGCKPCQNLDYLLAGGAKEYKETKPAKVAIRMIDGMYNASDAAFKATDEFYKKHTGGAKEDLNSYPIVFFIKDGKIVFKNVGENANVNLFFDNESDAIAYGGAPMNRHIDGRKVFRKIEEFLK